MPTRRLTGFHRRGCHLRQVPAEEPDKENNDVAALRVAVMDQRHPGCSGAERDVVDEQMVADEERVFHRTAGDHEILTEERQTRKSNNQDRAEAGEASNGSLLGGGGRWIGLLRR